jgi:hypothetical protein
VIERASQAGTHCATRRAIDCRVESGVDGQTDSGAEFPSLGAIGCRVRPRIRRGTERRSKSLIDGHIDGRVDCPVVPGVEPRGHPRIDSPLAGSDLRSVPGLRPPCSSHLGPTDGPDGNPERSSLADCGEGCSGSYRQNADSRPRPNPLEVFGENGVDHPGDYSGVYPGYAPKVSHPRTAVCALGIAPPRVTRTGLRRAGCGQAPAPPDSLFPFPEANTPPKPDESEQYVPALSPSE